MINVVYSTEHWIVPRIVIGILIVLGIIILVTEARARVAKGGSVIPKFEPFFIKDADLVKLFGTLILFAAYIVVLNILGFTLTSIIFVFLFNVLYTGFSPKAVVTSIIIALVASILISVLFGVVFKITLPSGMFTITFVDQGFTIY